MKKRKVFDLKPKSSLEEHCIGPELAEARALAKVKEEGPSGKNKVLSNRISRNYRNLSVENVLSLIYCPRGEFGELFREISQVYELRPYDKSALIRTRFSVIGDLEKRKQYKKLYAIKRVLSRVLEGESRNKFGKHVRIPNTNTEIEAEIKKIDVQIWEVIDSL
jgi:hypothetical protein